MKTPTTNMSRGNQVYSIGNYRHPPGPKNNQKENKSKRRSGNNPNERNR